MDAAGVALVLIGPGNVDQVYAVVACFWFFMTSAMKGS